MDFEKKIDRLEEIVEKMEGGELPLEESLKMFEEGVKLVKECQNRLSEAEQKVKVLLAVNEDGQAIAEDFKTEEQGS